MAEKTNIPRLNMRYGVIYTSENAGRRIKEIKIPELDQKYFILKASSLQGENMLDFAGSEMPLMADDEIRYPEEPVLAIIAPDFESAAIVKKEIEKLGCFAAEFNTIAIDDGIAMGHDGMLYSLPSRDIIADSIEYMVNAHKADAMICISNCDKITPGMLMAAMRLNIPTVFVSGGPMEAGEWNGRHLDLIDAMIEAADTSVSDAQIAEVERHACPGCGCCSGMFTANSMNSLNEAIGLALPGNGTIVATHINRLRLFKDAAELIVKNAYKYYQDGDASVLPRSIATRQAFLNAMSLDIAMGGSTNTVLHLLAVAQEAGVDFSMDDIDMLSRKIPCLCKVAPNTQKYHIQDVNRAGGIISIMNELLKAGLVDGSVKRVDGLTLAQAADRYAITSDHVMDTAIQKCKSAAGNKFCLRMGMQENYYETLDTDRASGCIRDIEHAYSKDGGLAVLKGNIAEDGCVVKTAGVDESIWKFSGTAKVFDSQESACDGILNGEVQSGDVVVVVYEGPKGGPGMQEMLYPTSYIKSRHFNNHICTFFLKLSSSLYDGISPSHYQSYINHKLIYAVVIGNLCHISHTLYAHSRAFYDVPDDSFGNHKVTHIAVCRSYYGFFSEAALSCSYALKYSQWA